MDVLPKRFGKYGLTIHPDKTRLVPFRKPQGERTGPDADGPGTFDFLGFTHFWARSRKGNWVLKRKTAASRFTRAVRTISQWCRFHRHDPIGEQHAVLCQKLRGHAGYYGITGNSPALARFHHEVLRGLAQVAHAATASVARFLGLVSPAPEALPRALPAGGPLGVPKRSERIT